MSTPKANSTLLCLAPKIYLNYMAYFEIILLIMSFLFLFCYSFRIKNGLPTKWPIFGMLPALLKNHSRVHEFVIEVMDQSLLTFLFKGPWFTNMKLLVTVDPANAHYILSQNFGNYPKGSKFKEISEILGDGIINTDSDLWLYHRKMAQSVLAHPRFHQFLVAKIWAKIETGLIPILEYASERQMEIEVQDLFGRFSIDTISTVMMDYDPGTLCIDLPDFPFSKALHDGEEAIVYRHIVPTCVWKFQRWLGIGHERKYKEAWKIIDDFIYGCITRKREKMSKNSIFRAHKIVNELGVDLITLYMEEVRDGATIGGKGDKLLRDTILTFYSAGRDTTSAALSWFFYLMSKNPHVLSKVKEELDTMLAQLKHHYSDDKIAGDKFNILSKKFDELSNKLTYLHAAILETLRLYPSVPFNAKAPIEPDTLPSGHRVDSSMQIILDMYAMGRMKSIWGEDCYEFKPERWILETGKIKHEPSYKFLAFSSGPRTCLGKNVSFTVMKAVVMAVVSKYRIEPVQGHPVALSSGIVLQMKYGLKVHVVPY